jgi:hypothetical protein
MVISPLIGLVVEETLRSSSSEVSKHCHVGFRPEADIERLTIRPTPNARST